MLSERRVARKKASTILGKRGREEGREREREKENEREIDNFFVKIAAKQLVIRPRFRNS